MRARARIGRYGSREMRVAVRETPTSARRRLARVALWALPVALLLVQIWWLHLGLAEDGRIRSHDIPDTESYVRLSKVSTAE